VWVLGHPHPYRLEDPLRADVHPFAGVVVPEQPAVRAVCVHPDLLEGLECEVEVLPIPLAHPVQVEGTICRVCKQHVHLHLALTLTAHQLLAIAVVLRYLERHLQQGAKPIRNGCQINFALFSFRTHPLNGIMKSKNNKLTTSIDKIHSLSVTVTFFSLAVPCLGHTLDGRSIDNGPSS